MYPAAMADGGETKPVLPPGSFITCSSDDTIRIWNLSANMATNTIYRRNIYSEDLIKTLYVDSDLSHIKENLDASVNNGDKSEADKQQAVDVHVRVSEVVPNFWWPDYPRKRDSRNL